MAPTNYILISEATLDWTDQVVMDFLNQYKGVIKEAHIAQHTAQPFTFCVQFASDIDFTHFCFAVNYFSFPIDHEQANLHSVRGYWSGDVPIEIEGKNLLIYVSSDTEYDDVTIISDSLHIYRFSFDHKFKSLKASEIPYVFIPYDKIYHTARLVAPAEVSEEARPLSPSEMGVIRFFAYLIGLIMFTIGSLIIILDGEVTDKLLGLVIAGIPSVIIYLDIASMRRHKKSKQEKKDRRYL